MQQVQHKIAVITDIHVMAEELLVKDGAAFQNYLKEDRKLLLESTAITRALVNELLDEKPELVLVCGDMTKDGELVSHQLVTELLFPLINEGSKVLVVPGNHDINNPTALYFDGDDSYPAQSIDATDFMNLYSEFGYKDAISHDQYSLSYVSEPINGLRVVAIDSCKYNENRFISRGEKQNICVTGGNINQGTMDWIKHQSHIATLQGKQIIAFLHHNVVEHFDFQGEISAPYLLDNFKQVQTELMDAGIRLVFTGHFHANDIAKTERSNGKYLYEVETGSPVTYPCPYRIVYFNNSSEMMVTTKFIKQIDYDLSGVDFRTYARNILKENIPGVVEWIVQEYYPMIKNVSKEYALFIKIPNAETLGGIAVDSLSDIIVDIMMKIYEGNNNTDEEIITLKKIDESIENLASELSRFPFLKTHIIKKINNMDYVQKIKVAAHSIFYNRSGFNINMIKNNNSIIATSLIGEKTNDLNYPIQLAPKIPTSAI